MQMSCLMVKIPLKQLSEITKRVDHILINIYIKKPRGIIVIDFTTTAAIFQRSKVMNLPKKLVEHSAKQKHQGYPLWRLSKKTLLNRPLKLQPPCFQPNVCFFWNRRWYQMKGDLFVVLCLMHTWKHQHSGQRIQKWILVSGCIGYQRVGCKESELKVWVERTWNVTCLWF